MPGRGVNFICIKGVKSVDNQHHLEGAAKEISAANRPTGKNAPAGTLRKEDAERVFAASVRNPLEKSPQNAKKGSAALANPL